MTETIVETKDCKQCGISFTITDKDREFYDKISPVFGGKKFLIPTPTFCPDCRQQRRLAFRNERKLYKRNCDASGKPIISIFSPDKPYKVYDQKIRRSDQWNPIDYGQDYDFEKTFSEQYDNLLKRVPMGAQTADSENCDYAVFGTNNKNCYLTSCMSYSENCLYARFIHRSQYCMDCGVAVNSQNCYECVDIHDCYRIFFSNNCNACSDSFFLENCKGCSHCFGCTNLVNKSYCFENQQYTQEEYLKKINGISLGSFKEVSMLREKNKNNNKNRIVKNLQNENCENCFGDYITNSKNGINIFDCFDTEDSKECWASGDMKDIYDASFVGFQCDLSYEVTSSEQIHNCIFSSGINLKNSLYTYLCINCSNLFGCVGLRNKQYCIFNKQYTKEGYEILAKKIIEHMQKNGERGEFFPGSISPFGYNETIAMEYFPLKKEEAIAQGYKRMNQEYPINIPINSQTFKSQDLPDDINNVKDEIMNKVIICEDTGKPFRIVKPELEFYRKHNLPLPHKHPDQRHLKRMQLRNPRKLRNRECAKCGSSIKTTYAPERPEIVYCEECYNHEIYG